MSSKHFHDLLEGACADLSHEEQLQFIQELTKHASSNNGNNRQRSLYEALSERGIIGSITDAPPDLGTNPTYLEGFGQHGS